MIPAHPHTSPSGPQANGEVATGCSVCAHPWTAHDPIAARFCDATAAAGFRRGCVCTTRPRTSTEGRAG